MPRGRKPAIAYTQQGKYHARPAEVEDLFKRTLKVVNEQIRRFEENMFLEKNVTYDKEQARQAKELAAAVTSLGQMFFRIQTEAKHAAAHMTVDEKIETVEDMVADWGRTNRLKFWRAMRALEYELNEQDQLAKNAASSAEPESVPGK